MANSRSPNQEFAIRRLKKRKATYGATRESLQRSADSVVEPINGGGKAEVSEDGVA